MQIERLKYEDYIVYLLTHNGEIISTNCVKHVPFNNEDVEHLYANSFAEQVRRCEIVDAGNVTKRKFYEAQLKAKNKEIDKILEVLE